MHKALQWLMVGVSMNDNPKADIFAHVWQWFGWGRDFLTPDQEAIETGMLQVQSFTTPLAT